MRTQDIEIGAYYRHKAGLMYGYAKALNIIKPMPKYKSKYMYDLTEEEKAFTEVYVKCEWTVSKNNSFGFIKYFRPCDLVKE